MITSKKQYRIICVRRPSSYDERCAPLGWKFYEVLTGIADAEFKFVDGIPVFNTIKFQSTEYIESKGSKGWCCHGYIDKFGTGINGRAVKFQCRIFQGLDDYWPNDRLGEIIFYTDTPTDDDLTPRMIRKALREEMAWWAKCHPTKPCS